MDKEGEGVLPGPFVSYSCYFYYVRARTACNLSSFSSSFFYCCCWHKFKIYATAFYSSAVFFPPSAGGLAQNARAVCRESRRTTWSAKPAAKCFTSTASPAWCVTSSCPRGRNSMSSTKTSLCAKRTIWARVPLKKSAWTQVIRHWRFLGVLERGWGKKGAVRVYAQNKSINSGGINICDDCNTKKMRKCKQRGGWRCKCIVLLDIWRGGAVRWVVSLFTSAGQCLSVIVRQHPHGEDVSLASVGAHQGTKPITSRSLAPQPLCWLIAGNTRAWYNRSRSMSKIARHILVQKLLKFKLKIPISRVYHSYIYR